MLVLSFLLTSNTPSGIIMYHASMGFCAYNFTLAAPTHTIPLSPRPRSSCPYDIATSTVCVFNRVKTELFTRAVLLYAFLSTSVHPVSLPRTFLYPVTISNRVSAQDSSPHPVSAQFSVSPSQKRPWPGLECPPPYLEISAFTVPSDESDKL